MFGNISGSGSYYAMSHYYSAFGKRSAHGPQGTDLQAAAVTPVRPAPAVSAVADAPRDASVQQQRQQAYLLSRQGAGRMEPAVAPSGLFMRDGSAPEELAVRMRIQYPEDVEGVEGMEEAFDDGKCRTCEERKYKDGSDDPGVSFKTATNVAPEAAASAIRSHEQEHVVREQAKAEQEDRRVVSQSVTLHTDICPECGKVYISGGTTRTATMKKPDAEDSFDAEMPQPERRPFYAVA